MYAYSLNHHLFLILFWIDTSCTGASADTRHSWE